MSHQTNETDRRVSGIMEKVAIGALSLVMAYQYNAIQTLEDRMYRMQSEKFTPEDAMALEDRIGKRIEAVQANMDNKLNTILYILSNGNPPKVK